MKTKHFNKIYFLIFSLLVCSYIAKAQPGNKVPFSTSPYSTNPITNPFGNDNNNNSNTNNNNNNTNNNTNSNTNNNNVNTENKNNNSNSTNEELLNSAKDKSDKQDNKDNKEKDLSDQNKKTEEDGATTETDKKTIKKDKEKTGNISVDQSNQIYGMDYFTNNGFSGGDKTVLTPPQDYRLGVGDEIIVNIFGPSELQQSYTIGRDGSIYPKFAGKIYLQGMSFSNARNLLMNKFRNIVASGSVVEIQMGKIRTIKVTFYGEVNRAGTATMSAFTSAISAIGFAGGVTKLANLRNIEIRRNGRIVNTIDLYEFIKNGGNLEDQYLEDGDVINIGTYDKLVKADGSFKRPMLYELKEDENLNNLIDLAGGPTFDARFSSVQIKSIINEQARIFTKNLKDINAKGNTIQLFDGDVVTIKKITPNYTNTAIISGAVNYPDSYEVIEGEKLSNLIKKAGGLTSDAYTSRAYVYRGDTNYAIETAKIDLNEFSQGDFTNDIEILSGDRINIISKKDFLNDYSVQIIGSVKKPTTLAYSKNLTLKDLLIASGGLTFDAENGKIEIASIIDSADNYKIAVKKATTWKTYKINPNLELEIKAENIILNPYDKVYVRRKANYELLETVTIDGEVLYPGEYPILSKNDKISDLIKRAGDTTAYAYIKGATFKREGIGSIAMNLETILNSYKLESKNKYDLLLKKGDKISIPRKNEIVSIGGQVLNPINVFGEPNPTNVKQYIEAAGGYSDRPWKDRISVISTNGKSKTTKRIFFIRKYPKVEQGSIVFVPKKPERKDYNLSWKDLTNFTSSLLATTSTLITTYIIYTKVK